MQIQIDKSYTDQNGRISKNDILLRGIEYGTFPLFQTLPVSCENTLPLILIPGRIESFQIYLSQVAVKTINRTLELSLCI